MTRSKALPVLLWMAALTLAGWILGNLPLSDITRYIDRLSAGQWLAWIGLNLAIALIAARRWWLLSDILDLPISFRELLKIRQAGQTVSFITPGPQFGGEPLQIYWLSKRHRLPVHGTLLALGLDRFYELWVNFGMLLLGVLLLLNSPAGQAANWREMLALPLFMLLALSMLGWLISRQPSMVLVWVKRLAERWREHPRLRHLDTHFERLDSELKRLAREGKPTLLKAFLLSLCGWSGLIAEFWLLLSVLDLALDFSGFLLILVAMRLAFLLPLPGGVGSLEAALFWAFQYLSLAPTAAIGLIALMRLRDAAILVLGLSCLRALQTRE